MSPPRARPLRLLMLPRSPTRTLLLSRSVSHHALPVSAELAKDDGTYGLVTDVENVHVHTRLYVYARVKCELFATYSMRARTHAHNKPHTYGRTHSHVPAQVRLPSL